MSNRISVKAKAFLAAYERCGVIVHAAKIAKCDGWCHYRWLERWPHYKAHFEKSHAIAEKVHLARCVGEAERRAVQGLKKVVRDKAGNAVFEWYDKAGNIIPPDEVDAEKGIRTTTGKTITRKPAMEHRWSDNLLMFIIKQMDTSYRENHKVEIGGELNHNHAINEDRVKQILADRESADLANTLARRVAVLAGRDGESAN